MNTGAMERRTLFMKSAMWAKLKGYAAQAEISVSLLIRQILKDWIEEKEQRND